MPNWWPESSVEISASARTCVSEGAYCLRCGYDLTGLRGDPRVCPECGHNNLLSELTISEQAISDEARKLETIPTLGMTGAWIAGIGMVILIMGCEEVGIVLASAGLGVGATCAVLFGRVCGFRPGWLAAQAWLYLAGWAWLLFFLGVATLAHLAYDHMTARSRFILLGILILSGGLFQTLKRRARRGNFRGPYSLAKKQFKEFCRETAVTRIMRKPGSQVGHA